MAEKQHMHAIKFLPCSNWGIIGLVIIVKQLLYSGSKTAQHKVCTQT